MIGISTRKVFSFDDVNQELENIRSLLQDLNVYYGDDIPENNVKAEVGALYLRNTNSEENALYVKQINEGESTGWINLVPRQYNLTVTGTNWTTIRAVGYAYQVVDEDGEIVWYLNFKISGSISLAATGLTITVAGVVFKNVSLYRQPVILTNDQGAVLVRARRSYTVPGTSTMLLENDANYTRFHISGDVELDEKPDFVDFI